MILTTQAELPRYRSLGPAVAQAINWLQSADLATHPAGRHAIDGERLFVIVEAVTPKPLGPETVWESHRRYADIQCLVEGAERMGWATLHEGLPVRTAYNPDTDKQLYEPLGVGGLVFDFRAGDAAIFFPEDTHAPCLAPEVLRPVKRAVFKVRLD